MSKLILLIVGAAWMAVLLPPLLRSRFDVGSTSSVSDFRRQLNTLQRAQAPRAGMPMRAMARPLAPSPRQAQVPQSVQNRTAAMRRPMPQRPADMRMQTRPADLVAEYFDQPAEPRHRRSHHTAELTRSHFAPEAAFLSPREVVRRRRVNVLYGLLAVTGLSLFLAFTTGSTGMVYIFTVAVIALVAYCYVLVQIRNQEYLRNYYGQSASHVGAPARAPMRAPMRASYGATRRAFR